MASGQKQKAKGLPKRYNKRHNAGYYTRIHARQLEKRLRRILRRNGKTAARAWADAHMMLAYYRKLVEG